MSSPLSWQAPAAVSKVALQEARHQSHQAIQLVAASARSYSAPDPEDCHASLLFRAEINGLLSQPFHAGAHEIQVGLNFQSFALVILGPAGQEEILLDGLSYEEASARLKSCLQKRGASEDAWSDSLPYEIPVYPQATGTAFGGFDTTAMKALGEFFSNAALLLQPIAQQEAGASPVMCWPHHFDIATLITLPGAGEEKKYLGIGLSPGDESYDQPYFYANPYPVPEATATLPQPSHGHWHRENWTGLVMTATDVAAAGDAAGQQALMERYVKEALAFNYQLLGV
ncbi:MAG: hypothetical protein AAFR61_20605 [Bacteroidota bacterium]